MNACMKKLLILFLFFTFTGEYLKAQQLKHVLGDIIVQLRPGSDINRVSKYLLKFNGQNTNFQIKNELSPPLRIWLVHFDFATINENEFLHKIRRIPTVENAQFNHLGKFRQTVPDDPGFDQQWMWVNTGQSGGFPNADIDIDLAWDFTTGGTTIDGQEIVVCVVEGANRSHPDLQGNLWFNEAEIPNDDIDNDNNGYVDDYGGWHVNNNNDIMLDNSFGHGTFVSGIVGGKGNNGMMVAGVNWDIKIMHVDFSGVSEANSIAAYTYPLVMRRKYNETAGQEGAFVVATNSSWGIDGGNPADAPIWCAMYDSLGLAGILSCGATTNENENVDLIGDLPTGCNSEYLISVTATDHEDVRTFSGFGVENVDLAAPGEDAVSINLNGGPVSSSGTSFATPIIAGMVGLLYAAPCNTLGDQALGAPAATARFVRDVIFAGVDLIPNLEDEVKYGGRANIYNAMQILLSECGTCPKPAGLSASDIIDTSASISWFSTDSTLSTTLYFRELGSTDWDIIDNAVSPVLFDNLKACTSYEVQLEDNCSNDASGLTDIVVFETDGCCVYPDGLIVTDFTETTASVEWSSIFAAQSYNLILNSTSGGSISFNDISDTNFEFSGLDSCTNYLVLVQTVCENEVTDFSPPVSFKTAGCGSCTDLPYCPSNSEDATDEWIAEVNLNTLNNVTGSNGGYANFTDLSTDLSTYRFYEINLAPGYSGFGFNEWFKVYIDFNQDGDFDDPEEEVFDAGNASNDPVSGEIFIPGDAVAGITRMRVVMKWNSEPTACEVNIEHGEVEDYCVNIIRELPSGCDPPTNFTVDDIGFFDADFAWEENTSSSSYEVRLKSELNNNWLIISTQNIFFSAINLQECINYETQIRSVCTDAKSEWSSSTFFKTECLVGTVTLPDEFNFLSVSPNPFEEKINIEFIMGKSTEVLFELIDINGRMIFKEKEYFGVGENSMVFNTGNELNKGVYFLKIETEHGVGVEKLIHK